MIMFDEAAGWKQAYERDGFLTVPGMFSPSEVAELRDAFMAQAAEGRVEGLNTDSRIQDPNDPLYRHGRMMHPHRRPELPIGPLSMRTMLDPRIGRVLEALWDEPPVAAQSMFYFKPPGARGQDLHQDNFYLRVKPGSCMAAWVAVDDADAENGGMLVVPGSHRFDIICPEASDRTKYFSSEHVDVPEGYAAVQTVLKASDVLFFNGSLIHGSNPNTSADRFRCSFICHYAPVSSREISAWYRPLYTFDGREHAKAYVEGGGPCGTAQEAVRGPH